MILFLIFLDYCPNYKLKKKREYYNKRHIGLQKQRSHGTKGNFKNFIKKKNFF